MKRRKALSSLGTAAAGVFIVPGVALTACGPEPKVYRFFSREEVQLLDEIGETILPATHELPGAKAVQIGDFLDIYVGDCFKTIEQEAVREGLTQLQANCQTQYQKTFEKLDPEAKKQILLGLEKRSKTYNQSLAPKQAPHYYTLLKNAILCGYFTSEVGATQALRYLPVPGKYEGNYPLKAGDTSWAI